MTVNSSQAIVDIFFGGVLVMTVDGAVGGTNNATTRFAFLEGGKTPIKVQINGSNNANFAVTMHSIRFELVTGKGEGYDVNIWGADADFEVVNGVAPSLTISTLGRFNSVREVTPSDAVNDQYLYPRYFSGGTYKVKLVFVRSTQGAIIDIGFGGVADNIFDGVDTGGTLTRDEEAFATVTIPRGIQDISFLSQAAGTGGDFRMSVQRLQFTKIATLVDAENDDTSDPVHGALVPLGKHFTQEAEDTAILDFATLGRGRFSEIRIIMQGQTRGVSTNGINVNLLINDIGTLFNWYGNRITRQPATNTPFDNGVGNTDVWRLATDTMINGVSKQFTIIGSIRFVPSTLQLAVTSLAGGTGREDIVGGGALGAGSIVKMTFTADGGTGTPGWIAGSTIDVYGVLR